MNSGDQVGDMDRAGQDTEPPDGNQGQCETSSRTVVGDGGDGGSDVERKASTGSDNDYNTEVITVRKSRSGSMSRYISFSIDDENKVIYSDPSFAEISIFCHILGYCQIRQSQ